MGSIATRSSSTVWRANGPFLIILVTYCSLATTAGQYWGIPVYPYLYYHAVFLFGFGVTTIAVSYLSIRVMLTRPEHLWTALKESIVDEFQLPARLLIGAPLIVTIPFFFSVFTGFKAGISRIVPFYADIYLIGVDRWLFGSDAWVLLNTIFGQPVLTFGLNFAYHLWFVVMCIVLFCALFSIAGHRRRSQYLVSFLLVWSVIGNLAATVFSSVGPAFLLPFYADHTFDGLMDYLRTADQSFPIWALDVQERLLTDAGNSSQRLGSGISAFPSLHVAVAALNAIYFWRSGFLLRWASICFLAIIEIGSIHLGWHYAADGIASLIITPVLWRVADWPYVWNARLLKSEWVEKLATIGFARSKS